MADAKSKLRFGSDTDPNCQHVTIAVTIDGETRQFVETRESMNAEKSKDMQFEIAKENAKTNYRLQSDKTDSVVAAKIEEAVFKV